MATINISNCTEEQLANALAIMLQALNNQEATAVDPQFTALAQQLIDESGDVGATINLLRDRLCEAGQQDLADTTLGEIGAGVTEDVPALITPTRDQWREIQTALQGCGLYSGAIDGFATRRDGRESQTQAGLRQLAERAGVPLSSIYNAETGQVADPARLAALTSACVAADAVVAIPPVEAPVAPVIDSGPSCAVDAAELSAPAATLSRENRNTNDRAAVRQLQTQLQTAGLYTGAIDGDFGPATRAAVIEAQGRLSQAGYDVGAVDGKWGVRSAAAYNAMLAADVQLCDLPEYTGPVPAYVAPTITSPATSGAHTDLSGGVAVSNRFDPQGCGSRLRVQDLTEAEWRIIRRAEEKLRERGDPNPEGRALHGWFAFVQEADCRGITRQELIANARVQTYLFSRKDVDYVYEDGCDTLRGEGQNGVGDKLRTELDTPSNIANLRQFRTSHQTVSGCDTGGGPADPNPGPNPGPNGGPTPGDPCGGCGGGPNASVNFDQILQGQFPALSIEERRAITGEPITVAEASRPTIAANGNNEQPSVAV